MQGKGLIRMVIILLGYFDPAVGSLIFPLFHRSAVVVEHSGHCFVVRPDQRQAEGFHGWLNVNTYLLIFSMSFGNSMIFTSLHTLTLK